ncbi:MAG: hypothetical protein JWM88_2289 [Verrucomicrobia bacterium]|nr:hypothetical protein [Verrucomicrobiota bacterium]
MQINASYLPKVSDQARLAALAEASQLLQEVGAVATAKKTRSLVSGSRWTGGFHLGRNGRRW